MPRRRALSVPFATCAALSAASTRPWNGTRTASDPLTPLRQPQSDHPEHDQCDRDHPQRTPLFSQEEEAHDGRADRSDPYPDGVAAAGREVAHREAEEVEA